MLQYQKILLLSFLAFLGSCGPNTNGTPTSSGATNSSPSAKGKNTPPTIDAKSENSADATRTSDSTPQEPNTPSNEVSKGDCRDEYPDYGWQRTTDNECAKVNGWMVGAGGIDGVLPGMAFVACKINGVCMRMATVNNCDYNYWPAGSQGLPTTRDETKYCRKDYKNYTFFRCHVDGDVFIGQSTDGTSYQDYEKTKGGIVSDVASTLPLDQGCPDKEQGP